MTKIGAGGDDIPNLSADTSPAPMLSRWWRKLRGAFRRRTSATITGTNYVILRLVDGPDGRAAWEQFTAQYARSRKAAVDAIVESAGPGSYRAITVLEWGVPDVRIVPEWDFKQEC